MSESKNNIISESAKSTVQSFYGGCTGAFGVMLGIALFLFLLCACSVITIKLFSRPNAYPDYPVYQEP